MAVEEYFKVEELKKMEDDARKKGIGFLPSFPLTPEEEGVVELLLKEIVERKKPLPKISKTKEEATKIIEEAPPRSKELEEFKKDLENLKKELEKEAERKKLLETKLLEAKDEIERLKEELTKERGEKVKIKEELEKERGEKVKMELEKLPAKEKEREEIEL